MKEGSAQREIAVVGSGIAGLSCAWLLGQRHRVTIYELQPTLGMDSHAVTLEQGATTTRVDVPMRVFFSSYYPLLTTLYDHLGIETEEVDYSSSFSSVDGEFYFQYDNYRFRDYRVPFLTWAGLGHQSAWRIGADALRFFGTLARDLERVEAQHQTLEQYLAERRVSPAFRERFLLPAYAGICTCSYESIRRYPASTILKYLGSGLLFTGVRRARLGAKRIVEKLAQNAAEVRCGAAVVDVQRAEDRVSVRDASGETRSFDHVVLATQANQTRRFLTDASAPEREMLDSFHYESSTVLVHTDAHLAPRRRAWWAPVNFLLREGSAAPMATIRLNPVHRTLRPTPELFQTWNPLVDPDPRAVLAESNFERPVVDERSLAGVERLAALHEETDRRIWFCGAFAAPGIPLLESAATSGIRVAERLGGVLPWEIPGGRSDDAGPAGTNSAENRRRGGAR